MSTASGTTANTKNLDKSKIDYSKCATLDTYDIEEKLTTARIALMIKKPFFGNLATRMLMVRADDWLPTAAVDGKHFYYNAAFIDALTPAETEFLFGHEVLHLVFDHILRVDDRDPQLFNIAADFVVNQTLVDEEVGKFPTTVPGLLDSKYKGLITEEVYELLKDQWEKDKSVIEKLIKQLLDEHDPWKKSRPDPNCPVHGDGVNDEEEGDDEGDGAGGDGEEGDEKGDGDGDGDGDGEGKGDGKGAGKGKGHGGDKQCTCSGKGKPGAGTGGKRPSEMSESERKALKDEIKEAVLSAAQAAGAGNVPASIKRMIDELTDPKMNWRELLEQQIQSTKKSDFSFTRPSRKSWATGAILPGMIPEMTIDICIAIDMSGSISNKQAMEFLSEVNGIMDEFMDFKIKLWCFDTKVYNEADFTGENREELLEYEVKGGGGTDFDVNWAYMKDQGIEPKKFIMFTDGVPYSSWGDENYCDTVFIINNPYDKGIVPPFGEYAYYEEGEE